LKTTGSQWLITLSVVVFAYVYFYWQYDWKGLIEVAVLMMVVTNMTEWQYRSMARQQQKRDQEQQLR
jgi:hypothetical protein